MNEWLKTPKLYLTLAAVLVVGIIATHYIDSKYYNNQEAKQANQDYSQEMAATDDFNNLADLTISPYANINPNCNQFKNGEDRAQCQVYEQSKQALEKNNNQ